MALINSTVVYTANANVPSTYTYTLSGGGAPLSGSGSSFSITWGNVPGDYTLNVKVKSNCDGSEVVFPKQITVSATGGTYTEETLNITLSTGDNQLNYDQFPDVVIPSAFEIGAGHGYPQYIESGAGLVAALRKGYTYVNNSSSYGEDKIPSTRSGTFKTPDTIDLPTSALQTAANNVSNDFASDPLLSTAKYITNANSRQFNLVSSTAAVVVGQYYQPATTFKPNPTCAGSGYNHISYMMFDSELYADTGDWHRVMWSIIQGIKNANTSIKQVLFYGRWASGFLQAGQLSSDYGVGSKMTFSQSHINSWVSNPSSYRWGQYRSSMSKVAVDLGQYFREPLPVAASLYKKDVGGNYILSAGKRVFRDDTFTENVYNYVNEYLPEPHNEIRYRYYKNTGGVAVAPSAAQPADFDSWVTGEQQYRDPSKYKTSVEWALEGIYRLHDLMQDGLRSITFSNFNVNDISTYRPWPADKPGAVFCPNTEPFTYGGNHWVRRWIGPEQLKWMYIDALFSGIYSIELWRDGTGGEYGLTSNTCPEPNNGNNIIRPQGQNLYPAISIYDAINVNNCNFAEVITGTINKVIQLYNGITFDNTLKFGSFSLAMQSARDKEFLGKYFYQGNKLVMYLWNPWNDVTDSNSVTLHLGTVTHSITLQGRNIKILTFDISGISLNNDNIKLEYTNIDAITRKVTGNILNHTW